MQSILTALGWSLLNSFWQMAILWIAFYLLTAGNKRVSATGKHSSVRSGLFTISFTCC
jgi:hypothetical protein